LERGAAKMLALNSKLQMPAIIANDMVVRMFMVSPFPKEMKKILKSSN
jgi:hypothetical protein